MQTKLFEIRDEGTLICAMAIKLDPVTEENRWILARAGYGVTAAIQSSYIILMRLDGIRASFDPYTWNSATMKEAHLFIANNWEQLLTGEVIDCQFNREETTVKKLSERLTSVVKL